VFACLNGAYPRGSLPAQPERLEEGRARRRSGEIAEDEWTAVADRAVREVIEEQEASGLGILSDGELRPDDRLAGMPAAWAGIAAGPPVPWPGSQDAVTQPLVVGRLRLRGPMSIDGWRFASSCTSLPVKQRIPGPYTVGRLAATNQRTRSSVTRELAASVAAEIAALTAAGCPMVEVEEVLDGAFGEAPGEQDLFGEVHARMTDDLGRDRPHLSLALQGAVPRQAGSFLFALPYHSYVLDLVSAPDNWHLVAAAPADRGIVCGIADAASPALDAAETIIWAAALASQGRSADRVGVAPNGSMAGLRREHARRKIEVLGEAVRVASMGPVSEVAIALVPSPGTSRIASLRAVWEAASAAGLGTR
jgi:5-methyltetrahydropteroyltriglutamate--homocysteine methyltransferase